MSTSDTPDNAESAATGTPPAADTFRTTKGNLREVVRTYRSFSQAADEAANARVYAGIHFGTGCRVGVDQGEKIARYGFENLLRPL